MTTKYVVQFVFYFFVPVIVVLRTYLLFFSEKSTQLTTFSGKGDSGDF